MMGAIWKRQRKGGEQPRTQIQQVPGSHDTRFQRPNRQRKDKVMEQKLEGILCDLVNGLCIAMHSNHDNIPQAMILLNSSVIQQMLVNHWRVSTRLLEEILGLIRQYVVSCGPAPTAFSTGINSYPDREGESTVQTKQAGQHFLDTIYDPLLRLLANSIGSDIPLKDQVLLTIVDTWTTVAKLLVDCGLRDWPTYLEYSLEAWSSLRDMDQKKTFTAYFFWKIIEAGRVMKRISKYS
jgi:hypothetical protein